jgi:hypothetical protein
MSLTTKTTNPQSGGFAAGYSTGQENKSNMRVYELRTYTLYVGKMAEAVKLYQELGFPALKKVATTRTLSGTSRAIPV